MYSTYCVSAQSDTRVNSIEDGFSATVFSNLFIWILVLCILGHKLVRPLSFFSVCYQLTTKFKSTQATSSTFPRAVIYSWHTKGMLLYPDPFVWYTKNSLHLSTPTYTNALWRAAGQPLARNRERIFLFHNGGQLHWHELHPTYTTH